MTEEARKCWDCMARQETIDELRADFQRLRPELQRKDDLLSVLKSTKNAALEACKTWIRRHDQLQAELQRKDTEIKAAMDLLDNCQTEGGFVAVMVHLQQALEAEQVPGEHKDVWPGYTEEDRSPYDGKPFYCTVCGLGFDEYGACELPDCKLESDADARARKAHEERQDPHL